MPQRLPQKKMTTKMSSSKTNPDTPNGVDTVNNIELTKTCCCGCAGAVDNNATLFKCRLCCGQVKAAWCFGIANEGSISGVCIKCCVDYPTQVIK